MTRGDEPRGETGPALGPGASRADADDRGTGSNARGWPDEAAHLTALREGASGALAVVYDRYSRACYSLARRVLGDDTLAQDVVQDVFIALWQDPGRYDPARGQFGTWLLSVTHHKAVDLVRREETRRRRTGLLADVQPAPEDVEQAAWRTVRRDHVRAALASLPPSQREALALAYFGGYTQREIAHLTATPLGTVKTRTLHGMRRLRDLLVERVDETASGDER